MDNIETMVNAAMAHMCESGKMEEIIQTKIEKVVTDVVDSELRSYSDFGKALTESIKSSMNVNFEALNFEAYNVTVLKIIQRMLDSRLQDATTKRLEADLATLLESPPENMKVSELIASFIEAEAEEASEDGHEEISFHYQNDRGNFEYISWDAKPGRERHLCDYQIGFHHGEPFSFRIGGYNPKEKMFMGRLYKFDRLMFQLYTAGVPIELDHHAVDTEYPSTD